MFIDSPSILKKLQIRKNLLAKEAVKLLENSSYGFLIVKNYNGLFEGILNDGDIRRGLIKGFSLNHKIENFYNQKPLSVKKKISISQSQFLIKKHDIDFIPYINKNKFLGFYFKKDIALRSKNKKKILNNCIVIMAGGKGTRLKEFTKFTPKPMLNIGGKPILETIVKKGVFDGFLKFIITINYLGFKIKKYFKNGSKFNAKISYINERKPLGTAGSLFLLKKKIDDHFIVTNGDLVSNIKYQEILQFHISNKADFTIGIKQDKFFCSYGVAKTKGKGIKVKNIEEKPVINLNLIAGVYVVSPSVLKFIKRETYLDMTDFIQILLKKSKNVIAFPIYENWQDIGNYNDFLETKR